MNEDVLNFMAYWNQIVDQEEERDFRYFNLQELNFYNGESGKPLYVAFNGMVYDFSHQPKETSYIEKKRIYDLRNNAFLKRFPIVGMLLI
jgi:predicted heme/steroid binding protein